MLPLHKAIEFLSFTTWSRKKNPILASQKGAIFPILHFTLQSHIRRLRKHRLEDEVVVSSFSFPIIGVTMFQHVLSYFITWQLVVEGTTLTNLQSPSLHLRLRSSHSSLQTFATSHSLPNSSFIRLTKAWVISILSRAVWTKAVLIQTIAHQQTSHRNQHLPGPHPCLAICASVPPFRVL